MIVKQRYSELLKLHDCGLNTWVTKVLALAQKYDIDLNMNYGAKFKQYCKNRITNQFKKIWLTELQNIERNPILRNYKTFKLEFGMEKYLDMVTDTRYHTAITRLRTSSHTMEIERRRYTILRLPVTDQLCCVCKVVEDGVHFLVSCEQYADLRENLTTPRVAYRFNSFTPLSDHENIFLMKTDDPYILAWLGKYIVQHLATTKQFYKWYFPSVCPSVHLSHLFHHVPTPSMFPSPWNFQELFPRTKVRSMKKVKVRGQRSRSQLNRFRTVTPVWIHIWWWNDAHSLMLLTSFALFFFKAIRQISRSRG